MVIDFIVMKIKSNSQKKLKLKIVVERVHPVQREPEDWREI